MTAWRVFARSATRSQRQKDFLCRAWATSGRDRPGLTLELEDAKGYVQDAQADGREGRDVRDLGRAKVRLSEDVASMQQRLISELRAETTLALSREPLGT